MSCILSVLIMQSYEHVGRNETVSNLLYLLCSLGVFFFCHSSPLQQGHLKGAGLGETWSHFSLLFLKGNLNYSSE